MQDYTKDLTLAFAGTNTTLFNNIDALLGDYIFGPAENEIEREVTILIPAAYRSAPGVQTLREWGEPMGMVFDFVKGDDPHEALDNVFASLEYAKDHGQETAFIMFYNPESTYEKDNPDLTDLEVICEAKNFDWLITLDLCQGLVDFFEGYESTDDRIKREALEEAFAEQQKAKEAAEKAAKPARKTATKKAATPRKRAAAKPAVMEEEPLPIEPEKPAQTLDKGWGPHEHVYVRGDDGKGHEGSFCKCGEQEPSETLAGLDKLVDDAVKREAEKKARREGDTWQEVSENGTVTAYQVYNGEIQSSGPLGNTLSGTIVIGTPELPEALAPVSTADVWADVAKAIPATTEVFEVSKADIVELGEAMEEMANAFGKAIRVYKNIVEGK